MHKAALDRLVIKLFLLLDLTMERMLKLSCQICGKNKKLSNNKKNANDNLLSPLNEFMGYLVSDLTKILVGQPKE